MIDDCKKVLVQLPDGGEPVPAAIVAQDKKRDIALLKIDVHEGAQLKPLRMGAADATRGTEGQDREVLFG